MNILFKYSVRCIFALSFTGLFALLSFQPLADNGKELKVKKSSPGESKWSGRLTLEERYEGLIGNSIRTITVRFNNVLPTLYRDGPAQIDPDSVLNGQQDSTDLNSEFTDDKGTGNVIYHAESYIGGKKIGVTDCEGGGKSQLNEVSIQFSENTYRIHAIGPACNGTTTDLLTPKTESYGPEFTDIIVDDKFLTDKNSLAGTNTEVIDLGGDLGTVTRTISWHLSRESTNAELIVTPENYHDWMPEPGINELTKGNSIKIGLKVRGPNGQPPTSRVRSFELKLSNTSNEPGITLNAPLTPLTTLPDLRFLIQSNAAITEEFQKADIRCQDGSSGSIIIGSFDGGGYTTLNAVAILEDNSRIEGHLLISGGNTEIPIPKRAANSNIAIKWWNANNNPADDYDDETSVGNSNNGDGLTAYEEYRGIMLQGVFKRLSPDKKELGIWMKKSEYTLFSGGISLLKTASGLEPILFYDNEIAADRKFNRNFKTANIYQQYVLKLVKDKCPEYVFGQNRPINVTNKVPKLSQQVVIDIDKFRALHAYYRLNRIRPTNSEQEEIDATVAHELGHGIHISHHGNDIQRKDLTFKTRHPYIIILDKNKDTIYFRPKKLTGFTGIPGNQASGDLNCIMAYTDYFFWAANEPPGKFIFAEIPPITQGKILCRNPDGTKINAEPNYFYDATAGDCLGKIKLKD